MRSLCQAVCVPFRAALLCFGPAAPLGSLPVTRPHASPARGAFALPQGESKGQQLPTRVLVEHLIPASASADALAAIAANIASGSSGSSGSSDVQGARECFEMRVPDRRH